MLDSPIGARACGHGRFPCPCARTCAPGEGLCWEQETLATAAVDTAQVRKRLDAHWLTFEVMMPSVGAQMDDDDEPYDVWTFGGCVVALSAIPYAEDEGHVATATSSARAATRCSTVSDDDEEVRGTSRIPGQCVSSQGGAVSPAEEDCSLELLAAHGGGRWHQLSAPNAHLGMSTACSCRSRRASMLPSCWVDLRVG